MAVSLHEVISDYLLYLEMSDTRPNTLRNNKSSILGFAAWAETNDTFPLNDFSQIKPKHIREYFHFRKVEQGVGPGTRQQNHIHLTKLFDWAKREYKKVKKNPLHKVERPNYRPPRIEFPLEGVIDKMIAVCDTTSFKGIRDRLLITLLKETGGRASEILALEESDINEVEKYIYIRWGKGGNKRKVGYTEETAIAIIAYKQVRETHPHAKSPKFFIGTKGALKYCGLNDVVKGRSFEATGEETTAHKLRHAFVHLAKTLYVTEDALMEMMGWKTRAMLDRYALSMREERALAEYRNKLHIHPESK